MKRDDGKGGGEREVERFYSGRKVGKESGRKGGREGGRKRGKKEKRRQDKVGLISIHVSQRLGQY